MKIMTVLGTRPEIIRLSLVISLLDRFSQHVLVHTGQNYEEGLSQVFFDELGVRKPDVYLGVRASTFGGQIGQILGRCETLLLEQRPDRLLVLGDTNSGLAAIIARRLGIPVYHMEAGNRCYDDRVPEEINRRIIDHSSSVLMPYTQRSRENLIAEGLPSNRIYVTGNPIKQVIDSHADRIAASDALDRLNLKPGCFFLGTAHRAENVDREDRLHRIIEAFEMLQQTFNYPVVVSLHPRTLAKIEQFGIPIDTGGVRYLPPLGFFDFVRLEQSAFCLLSDSGTVQEEACIFKVPNVTIRDVTERPETLDCGSNILCGVDPLQILNAVKFVTASGRGWEPPIEYTQSNVAESVARILLSYRLPDTAETL